MTANRRAGLSVLQVQDLRMTAFTTLYHQRTGHAVAQLVGAGRSRVQFPMVSTKFSISNRSMALGLTQPLTEMSTRNISWGVKAASA
jgi:hypothetical protein